MKIHPVGGELFNADRWTDKRTEEQTRCNFANASKKGRAFLKFVKDKYSGKFEMHRITPYEIRLSNVITFRNTKFVVEYLTFLLSRREGIGGMNQVGSNQYSSSCVQLYVTMYGL